MFGKAAHDVSAKTGADQRILAWPVEAPDSPHLPALARTWPTPNGREYTTGSPLSYYIVHSTSSL